MGKDDGFMNNEKLHSMIENLSEKVTELFLEVRKNNSIKEDVEKNNQKLEEIQKEINITAHEVNKILDHQDMKENMKNKIFKYSGWIIGIISTSITIIINLKGI